MSQDWIIAQWPDGTWCDKSQVDDYMFLGWSDDFELRRVLSWDGAYEPILTAPL